MKIDSFEILTLMLIYIKLVHEKDFSWWWIIFFGIVIPLIQVIASKIANIKN